MTPSSPPRQLNSLRRFDWSNDTYADLLVDATNARAEGSAAVARAASAKWRKHDKSRRAFLGPQQAALDDILLDKIQIRSSARVQTVAREGVEFPITIRNTLEADPAHPDARAVKVKLVFNSDNPQRLTIKTIKASHLNAQDSFTDNAEVTAKANGVVPVTAQLMTESGRPVGRPFDIEVQVTQNGTTGWAIAIAAGIVLVGSSIPAYSPGGEGTDQDRQRGTGRTFGRRRHGFRRASRTELRAGRET